jgi:general secretion pathway protein B
MSYILDALRRAEADRERERGQVPGLHTQPPSGNEAAPAGGRRGWLPWAGGGLLLLAGVGAGIWWASGPQESASSVAMPGTPPAATAPRAAVATAPLTSPAAIAPPGTQTAVSGPMPPPAAPASPFLPPAPPPVAVATAPVAAPAVAAKQVATIPAAPPASAPAADARIPRLSELPESTRRELPRLAISGSVYSEQPASRFVIINGEVAREGATLGADLVLEEIRSHELVLRFKGQRYRQPV